MSETLGRPDFFGKDDFTPFIGVVEDVNDPLMSGRVKVRCIGWHPKDRIGKVDPVVMHFPQRIYSGQEWVCP